MEIFHLLCCMCLQLSRLVIFLLSKSTQPKSECEPTITMSQSPQKYDNSTQLKPRWRNIERRGLNQTRLLPKKLLLLLTLDCLRRRFIFLNLLFLFKICRHSLYLITASNGNNINNYNNRSQNFSHKYFVIKEKQCLTIK